MKQLKFQIGGMTCSSCSAHVQKAVEKLDGVNSAAVNLLSNSMTVDYNEAVLQNPIDIICEAVEKAGYTAALASAKGEGEKKGEAEAAPPDKEFKAIRTRLIVSFAFLIPLFYISMGHMMGLPLPSFLLGHENAIAFAFTQFLLCLPVIYVNFKYFTIGYKMLFRRTPNMDSLIAIGTTAAMLYGIYAIYKIGYGFGIGDMEMVHSFSMDLYFESAAMILALVTLGKFLEARAKARTSDAIAKLMDLAPKTASVLRDGIEQEVPVGEVVVGDIVVIRPGQAIPVDGTVLEGKTAVDESAITGESIPVEKQEGDHLVAGTVNKAGFVKAQATKVGDDTTLSQIIRLVEEAASSKAPISKLADKVSGIFVPIVIGIAAVSFLVWLIAGQSFEFSISVAIAVLVISCPCALGLATPTAIMVATGRGAQLGILIKSAESLEILHEVGTVVLDKTGTITEGKPSVSDIVCIGEISETELLKIAASIEAASEHPLAEAVIEKARSRSVATVEISEFESLTGKGISARVEGTSYFAGNDKLMLDNAIAIGEVQEAVERLSHEGKTVLYIANSKAVIGIIGIIDNIKSGSIEAIKALRRLGIRTVMLTGDNRKTAQAVRELCGTDEVVAEVLPADKEQHIRALQQKGQRVCMIGDGINDSPALARADVGMAIGAGTDIAIEAADVVLMKSDLLDAVSAIRLSRATIRNIKQNLFWALFYNALGIPLAAGVFFLLFDIKLNPMFAAAAMSISSVCVVLNALRLKWFKPGNNKQIKAKMEERKMIIKIEGMSCGHCSGRVEAALNAIDGVAALVNLEKAQAEITLTKEVSAETLTKAVTDAGYKVIGIE